jgi:antitoxin MazE
MESVMVVQFAKWGNSIALRIPMAYAKDIGAAEGGYVDISLRDGKLIVTPVEAPVYDLSELVAGITDENLHVETSTASAVGNEF